MSMLAKSGGSGSNKKKEDTFGMRDEDWDIYKAVSKVRNHAHCFDLIKYGRFLLYRTEVDLIAKPSKKS